MRMKRTRPIKKWFITIPRVAIPEAGIYQIKAKISQVIIEKIKDLPGTKGPASGPPGGTPPGPSLGKGKG